MGSYDGSLYAVNAMTGRVSWTYPTGNFINGAPAVVGNLAVFGGCDGLLHAVSLLDGREASAIPAGSYIPASPPYLRAGPLRVPLPAGCSAWTIATAKIAWQVGGEIGQDGAGSAGFFSSPAAGAGVVVIGSRDGRLDCVDAATGKRRWTWDAGAAVDGSPVIAGDAIVVGTMDGRLVVLSLADGRQRWSYEIGGPIAGSPALAAGMVIVGSDDGSLYAFGAPP